MLTHSTLPSAPDGVWHPALAGSFAGAFMVAFTAVFSGKQAQAQAFGFDECVFAQGGQFAVAGKLGSAGKVAGGK